MTYVLCAPYVPLLTPCVFPCAGQALNLAINEMSVPLLYTTLEEATGYEAMTWTLLSCACLPPSTAVALRKSLCPPLPSRYYQQNLWPASLMNLAINARQQQLEWQLHERVDPSEARVIRKRHTMVLAREIKRLAEQAEGRLGSLKGSTHFHPVQGVQAEMQVLRDAISKCLHACGGSRGGKRKLWPTQTRHALAGSMLGDPPAMIIKTVMAAEAHLAAAGGMSVEKAKNAVLKTVHVTSPVVCTRVS